MAGGGSDRPAGGDGQKPSAAPTSGKGRSSFSWSSPTPSPADILEMERLFPEVIQLPSSAIDREVEDWAANELIARTLSRWVPSEAVIREFRRSGLAGRIDIIQLAHRTFLLKFEHLASRNSALMQPWIINGQPLAMEPWRPDFIPGEEAVSSALLWIRLPCLPIEYWNDETLSSILSVAGSFVGADTFTMERRRGGYARASVRVDLSKALRPGARIRGRGSPFWQAFVYEQVDCICPSCASVHLAGSCSPPSKDDAGLCSASPVAAPLFGPWMAAIRQRNSPMGKSFVGAGQFKEAGEGSNGNPITGSPASQGEWLKPGKTSRRKVLPAMTQADSVLIKPNNHGKLSSGGSSSLNQGELEQCRVISAVPVTVHNVNSPSSSQLTKGSKGRRKLKQPMQSIDNQLIPVPLVQLEANSEGSLALIPFGSQDNITSAEACSKMSVNGAAASTPFQFSGSVGGVASPRIRVESNPASLKRARASEPGGLRLYPKAQKGKSRGPSLISCPPGPVEQPVIPDSPQGMQTDKGLATAAPTVSIQQPTSGVRAEALLPEHGLLELEGHPGDVADKVMLMAQVDA